MNTSDEIRKFVVENLFNKARAEGKRTIAVVSGEVHSAMRLKGRMPSVCGALRGKELQRLGSVRLVREIRMPRVKLNSSTNKFEFEILDSRRDENEADSSIKAESVEQARGISTQRNDGRRTLVVIPCGRNKIWKKRPDAGPTRARDAYTGSPFKVNREYAERFADRWVVLSAKYGLIGPDFEIPGDYNVTFGDPATSPISLERLKEQARQFGGFDRVVALGGTEYAERVKSVFQGTGAEVLTPTAGLPIGKAMGKVKEAIRLGQPFASPQLVEYSERDLSALEGKLGVRFSDPNLLVKAVTRRAYVKELKDIDPHISREDNERLEFLGDGALELAVRHCLYNQHKGHEGDLSEMADELVSDVNLARIANILGLERHLFLGKSEISDEIGKLSILADALEAIIGAIYLDHGLEKTIDVVERLIINRMV